MLYFWPAGLKKHKMIQQSGSRLSHLAVHYVGNPVKEEGLRLSAGETGLDEATLTVLWEYLTKAFREPEYYQFWHPTELALNPVYDVTQRLWQGQMPFMEASQKLARLLYNASQHPQVRSGELLVVSLENVRVEAYEGPALALFKSEEKQPFLFTEEAEGNIELYSYRGISPGKVDKACLILQQDEEAGYQVLCVDHRQKGSETQFWFDRFLQLERRHTAYSQTSELVSLTKQFVEEDLEQEAPLEKDEAIRFMQRSRSYLEEQETYEAESYGQQVFEDPQVADRFRAYVAERLPGEEAEGFAISEEALKRKQKVFKSVIKLDKNFHIYVHGDRRLIEKGVDEQGRAYYKLYYEEEG